MSSSVLYTVMTGLEAVSGRQAMQSNNLVNASTPGFHAQLATLMDSPVRGPAADAGLSDVVASDAGYSLKRGALQLTSSPWDVALTGADGWLVTQSPTGQLLLTQDGRLHLGTDGLLQDSHGNNVLGANLKPISLPPLKHIEIGTDGTISGVEVGSGDALAQQVNHLYIAATPAQPLVRLGGGRFGGVPNVQALTPSTGTDVKQGYLNASDVNAVRAMTDLIADVRSFQIETQLQHSTAEAASGLDTLVSQG
ncbi:MAG TPA: flagellar hook-basal body complex protein [Rhodanobacteraceae bacterium]